MAEMRAFDTGATRNVDAGRIDPEAFIDPQVLLSYSNYMNRNRLQADGKIRDGDNWQKGIPLDAYAKSLNRHHLDFWLNHRGHVTEADQITNLNAILFNVMGYLSELLKKERADAIDRDQGRLEAAALEEYTHRYGDFAHQVEEEDLVEVPRDGEVISDYLGKRYFDGAEAIPDDKRIVWYPAQGSQPAEYRLSSLGSVAEQLEVLSPDGTGDNVEGLGQCQCQ